MDKKGYDSDKSTFTFIETIEAVSTGVSFGYLDDNRMVQYGAVILRTTTFSKIAEGALEFAYKQLGKPYDYPLTSRCNTSEDSAEWYCSELVYASYYSTGLDLCAVNEYGYCMPFDLIKTSKTYFVSISDCVDCILLGKTDGQWQIEVYNMSSSSVTLEYNAKLAFESDAKNWTSSLKDIETVTLKASSYTTVLISTNVFATTAAFSVETDTGRSVTYCNELNNNTLRMSEFKNIITT
ncbi:MAG: hypothetical protein LUD48_03140 [Prevotella sp.]|nr:hypothetical protein [Prevotella sp.]